MNDPCASPIMHEITRIPSVIECVGEVHPAAALANISQVEHNSRDLLLDITVIIGILTGTIISKLLV